MHKIINFLSLKFGWKVIKNTDSFVFVVRRFRNSATGKYWWLINLKSHTIITNNQGE